MLALSRARIPVTLCDWRYVQELDEWQLVIATPWYDSKGPHEAFAKIVSALSNEGIYADVPIRRVFVKSPDDPLVKILEQEIRFKTEGAIHIVDYTRPNHSKQYSIVFAPFTGRGGAVPARRISGLSSLREFLEERVHISKSDVDQAIRELERRSSASIPHVQLTKREAETLGLA